MDWALATFILSSLTLVILLGLFTRAEAIRLMNKREAQEVSLKDVLEGAIIALGHSLFLVILLPGLVIWWVGRRLKK